MCANRIWKHLGLPQCVKTKPNPLPAGCSPPARLPLLPTTELSGAAPRLFTFFTWCDRRDTKVLRNVCRTNTFTRMLQQGPGPALTLSLMPRHVSAFLQFPLPAPPRPHPILTAASPAGRQTPPWYLTEHPFILSPCSPSLRAPEGGPSSLSLSSLLSELELPSHTFQLKDLSQQLQFDPTR